MKTTKEKWSKLEEKYVSPTEEFQVFPHFFNSGAAKKSRRKVN
jgi:hypothetical protein